MIEEDALVRKLLEKRLLEAGWEVSALRSAADLDGTLAQVTADLIMIDMGHPDMSGLAVVEHIRDLGIRTPIMVLTTFEPPHLHAIVEGSGANAVVRKPYDQEELILRMRGMLAA